MKSFKNPLKLFSLFKIGPSKTQRMVSYSIMKSFCSLELFAFNVKYKGLTFIFVSLWYKQNV